MTSGRITLGKKEAEEKREKGAYLPNTAEARCHGNTRSAANILKFVHTELREKELEAALPWGALTVNIADSV